MDDDLKQQRIARSAAKHRRVREAHQTELAEDYVELIAELIDDVGEARVVDLAERLGVTNASVNATVRRLVRDGLVEAQKYRSIFLTDDGRQLAEDYRARHELVRDFLVSLGVDPQTADADAEGIEHHVSETTLKAFKAALKSKRATPKS